MNSAAVDPKVEEQRMTDKQGETADAEVGDDFKYDQARVLSWVDPERVRRMMDGLTGLEVNEAIRDGRLPEPTLPRVLGIRGRSGLAAPVRPRLGAQGPSRGAATHLTPFLRKCQILTDKVRCKLIRFCSGNQRQSSHRLSSRGVSSTPLGTQLRTVIMPVDKFMRAHLKAYDAF
jgi:hypothetical protein